MLYSSLLFSSFLLVVLYLAYRQRGFFFSLLPTHIQDRMPAALRPQEGVGYARLGTFDWGSSIQAGLNSSLFDIEANVRDGDQRTGLDERGAMDIQTIMQQYGVVSALHHLEAWNVRVNTHRQTC